MSKKTRKKVNQISENKGITLVALVITIIVIIILSVVAINFTFGSIPYFAPFVKPKSLRGGAALLYIPPCRWDTGEEAAAGRAVQSVIAFPGQSWYDKHGAAQRPPPALSLFSRGSGGRRDGGERFDGGGPGAGPAAGKGITDDD